MPGSGSPTAQTAEELQRVIAAERAGAPFLQLRSGSGEHRIHRLAGAAEITVGRGTEHALGLRWDPEVSRLHAELRRLGNEWVVEDNGLSSNGTFVNGERVTGARRLRDGDSLRFGRTAVVFRSPSAGSETAPAGEAGVPVVGELTPTQLGVLTALVRPIVDGQSAPASNPEIAAEVFLSVDAVKDYLRVLFRKFDLTDLAQFEKRSRLAAEALRWGIVSERDVRTSRER